MKDGEWRMEDGELRIEDGGWRMEDIWRMEDGGWRIWRMEDMEDGGCWRMNKYINEYYLVSMLRICMISKLTVLMRRKGGKS